MKKEEEVQEGKVEALSSDVPEKQTPKSRYVKTICLIKKQLNNSLDNCYVSIPPNSGDGQ